jgi:hypothetical protein
VAIGLACGPIAIARADGDPPPTPARSLATRGPLALSLAAGPGATLWSLETGWPLGTGVARANAGVAAPPPRGLRLDALVLASSEQDDSRGPASGLAYTLLLDHHAGSLGNWLGLSLGGPQAPDAPRTRLRLATGLARALTGLQVEATLVSSSVLFHDDPRWTRTVYWRYQPDPDTMTNEWRDTSSTMPADHSSFWTTAQGSLRWQRGRWAMETVGGLSLGEGAGPRRWAQSIVRVQVSRRVLVLGSLGQRPAPSLAFDGAAHPRTMIGVQLAPWSTPEWEMGRALHPVALHWKTEGAGPGRAVIRVHCRDTRAVEIAGDFTDWKPVALMPLHGGWWGGMVKVDPGLHRVQLRLDGGAWIAPPGLPRAEEGPAGEAGSLIVP